MKTAAGSERRTLIMDLFDILQLAGGVILAVGYIPQIAQIIHTKSCADLNLKTYLAMIAGIGLMEVYAINLVIHGSGLMFLITNSISLILVTIINFLIVFLRKPTKNVWRWKK